MSRFPQPRLCPHVRARSLRLCPHVRPCTLRRGFRRILSLSLSLSLLRSVPAAALPGDPPPAPDGVAPLVDEAYYAVTDYYGNLTDGSVVKSYVRNGADTITDAGQYEQVVNLTDGSEPAMDKGTVTFTFGPDAPERFYFEGKTSAPFNNLPWRTAVRYTLNGVPARAEDLAGKTGVVEIIVDAAPNPDASEYARNNYVLVCSAIFNQDDIISLDAPGGQLQLIGNLRTALFLAFPGEEKQFVFRVGADSFHFGGLTMLLMPATMSQLEEITKLSEKKNDLEDSYHKLSDSLDTMLDAFREMQDSLYETADGLEALDKARQTVAAGKNSVYSELDRMQGDLSRIASAMDPVAGLAGEASRSITETKGRANTLVDTTLGLREDLAETEEALELLTEDLTGIEGSLERLEENLENLEASLDSAEGILGRADGNLDSLGDSLDGLDQNMGDLGNDLSGLIKRLDSLDDNLSDLEDRMEETSDGLGRLENNKGSVLRVMNSLSVLKTSLSRLQSALNGVQVPTYTAGSSRSGQLGQVVEAGETLEQLMQTGENLEVLYSLTAPQGAQEAAFFTAMLVQQGKSQAEAAQLAAVLATNDTDAIAAADPSGALTAAYQQLYGLYNVPDFSAFFAAILVSQGYSEADAAQAAQTYVQTHDLYAAKPFPEFFQTVLTGRGYSQEEAEQAARLWRIYENNDRSMAALELVMDTADDVESDISSASSQAAAALSGISKPAAAVLGDLSGLCGNLDGLAPMLSSARSLSRTLQDTLDSLGDLSGTLRDTTATLQDASASLRDTTGSLQNTADTLGETVEIGEDAVDAGLDAAENLKAASAGLRDLSGAVRGASGTARELLDLLSGTTVTAREILEDTDALRVTLNSFEPTAQKSLQTLGNLSDAAAAAVRDANRAITAAENVTRPAGRQLDDGAEQTLDGLSSTIRTAADGLDTTTDVQAAKDAVSTLIEDTWDEYTGDINNLLLMDAGAEAESLTSGRNPSPQTVQVMIRTAEIQEEDTGGTGGSSGSGGPSGQDSEKPTTFLGRLGKMFRDLWDGITGLFR